MNLKKPDFDFSQVKVPQVVQDIYADLRDRKLLPIVGLLLVAIVAVPILLSSSGSAPSVTETQPAEVVSAPEAQAAVLAEDPGLRDYQQRLDALKAKNPFDQQYTATVGGLTETTDTGGELPTTDTGVPTDTGSSSTPPPSSGGGGSTDTAAEVVTDDTTVDVDETVENPAEPTMLAFRVDLQFGPEGDVKKHKNVKLLDVLDPVGAFIGGTETGSKAVFSLSGNVAAVTGEGECAPDPGNCDFLLLKEGQSANLVYQPEDDGPSVSYKLAIDEIRLVEVKTSDIEGKLGD